jgi:hypothetical protein
MIVNNNLIHQKNKMMMSDAITTASAINVEGIVSSKSVIVKVSDLPSTEDPLITQSSTTSKTSATVIQDTRNCVVCSHLNSSYKCPLCYSRYCSIDCYQSHRRSCNEHVSRKDPVVTTTTTTTAISQSTDLSANKTKTDNTEPQEISVDDSIRSNSISHVVNSSTNNNSNDEDQLLDEAHKDKMRSSKHLRSLLRSKRLRADIVNIDTSSDRQETLKALRSKNKEFEAFIDVLLKVVKSPDKK